MLKVSKIVIKGKNYNNSSKVEKKLIDEEDKEEEQEKKILNVINNEKIKEEIKNDIEDKDNISYTKKK